MSVYVDNMEAPFGRMIMCHMFGDTEAELHEMAQAIGIARKWFQGKGSAPHYDICKSKKVEAIDRGAIQIKMGSSEWKRVYDRVKYKRAK